MNINERAMNYAKENNYYKISKIKKYLRLYDSVTEKLKYNLKPSICPKCSSDKTTILNSSYINYFCEDYIICEECWYIYSDNKYIDKINSSKDFNYIDEIGSKVWAYGAGEGYKWIQFCDKEIDRMIKSLRSQL